METITLLQEQAAVHYLDLWEAITDLSEEQAWAQIQCQPDQYLHTEGSILSIVAHIASCKYVYGGYSLRAGEYRWRDMVARLDEFWPDWDAAKGFLADSQEYWMSTWDENTDLSAEVEHFQGRPTPVWKIISTVNSHDVYHCGQIQMIASTVAPSASPPTSETAEWKVHCEPLPSW